jgi:uncharacterized protein
MDCQPVSNERGAGTTPANNTDDPDGSDNGGFADSLSEGGYEFYIDASWRIDDGVTNWCMVTHESDDDGGYRVIGVVGGYAGGGDFAVEPFYYELDKDDPDNLATLVFFEMGAGNLNTITGDEDDRFEPDHQTRDIATAAYIVFKKWHEVDRWLDDNELVLLGEMRSHPNLVRVAEGRTVSLEIHSDVVDGTSTDQMRVMSELGFTRAPTVSSDDDDDDDDEGNDASITGPETPNGILGLNYILLGKIRKDWPDEYSNHIEPACVADDEQVRIRIAWAEDLVAIQIDEDFTQFRYASGAEHGDGASELLRNHVRSFLQSHPEWGLDGEILEEAATIITSSSIADMLDGDEEDRGWRCETGEYRVSGWNGTWGELDEDGGESAYTSGFYLSVVAFTERRQVSDPEKVEIVRDEDARIVHMDLNAAVSDLNHQYFVGVRKKRQATRKQAATSRVTDRSPGSRTAPSAAQPVKVSTNWIVLIIMASVALAGLMYASSKLIAADSEPSQPTAFTSQRPSADTMDSLVARTPEIPQDAAPELPEGAVPASKPSFDCNGATTTIERTLCSDAALGDLDRILDEKYERLKSAGAGGDVLLSTQRLWLAQRNACADRDCLAEAYRNRIRELDETIRGDTPAEGAPQSETTQDQVSNPGFDCNLHKRTIEQAICADTLLGDLHRTMAEKYAALSYAGAGGDVLIASQKFWMEYRDRCTDNACLVEAYASRIRDLDEFADSKR